MEKETVFLILIFRVVIDISLGFVVPAITADKQPQEKEIVQKESTVVNYTNFTLLVTMKENICEECHLSGKKLIPQAESINEHARGGAYCLKCHRISHEKHPVNDNVTCAKCHGDKSPKIPSIGDEVCGRCHAYPDPLLPSGGNLITIHRPRGVNCISCHTNCARCHEEIQDSEKWKKRTDHFDTLITAYKKAPGII